MMKHLRWPHTEPTSSATISKNCQCDGEEDQAQAWSFIFQKPSNKQCSMGTVPVYVLDCTYKIQQSLLDQRSLSSFPWFQRRGSLEIFIEVHNNWANYVSGWPGCTGDEVPLPPSYPPKRHIYCKAEKGTPYIHTTELCISPCYSVSSVFMCIRRL